MALMRSFLQRGQALLQDSLIPLLARTGLAATFWLSGQSKVEGLVLDILGGMPPELDVPHITRSAVALFATEYRLPFLAPAPAALLAAGAEHIFPVLLVLGLATRFSALVLAGMTIVIQVFVYPDAWPVHATWLTAQMYLLAYGGGKYSLDNLLKRTYRRRHQNVMQKRNNPMMTL
ncbi:DoxX family protein [Escherichia coli]|uniref:DoxX family protein n=1 Tax=Escherichia coli TaxID=562 RepID=UPI000BDF5F94|nr:DoxX family protein [Escherichia coli]EAZ3265338.1 DoxX family protein [Salmonella enterica]MCK3661898.1 DoxX family protein [Escherichia coli]PCS28974.1 TQO small subunit DoxD family protein [Escherichia coli]PHL37703.1 TQO small subunit DoxD family protein [Escherichia coli]HDR7049408.1 DoxX family protein [Escherichia coli]